MNTDGLLTVGIALCCVFALGTAASTLGSSVSTDPDEVVDADEQPLPIEPDTAGDLKRQAQSKQSQAASAGSDDRDSSASADQQDSASASANANRQRRSSVSSLLDDLIALLRWLLEQLRLALALVAFAAGVVVGVRIRGRLLASTADADGATSDRPTAPDPSNEVERAWWAMVDAVGVEDARTKTPRECADAAVAAGADDDAVAALTRTFEAVRYGGAPVTDDRANRARRSAEEVAG
ncbi:DUF4129 domain-containing protein [Halomicrococcus sp. SG-WS-1]|uniref:DUF4129 domain-containing protein n=1 Tax=Halomicrococcus sp. SG-WS-1 TaxID=3439057 RepID=UPI003F7A9E26